MVNLQQLREASEIREGISNGVISRDDLTPKQISTMDRVAAYESGKERLLNPEL